MIVGIIANPVSARDIRRVIANAACMTIADRSNILLRVMASLGSCGVSKVLMMPENGGISRHLSRSLKHEKKLGHVDFPSLDYTDTPVNGSVEDTFAATQAMVQEGVEAIIVLGGDGTHRAVAKYCGQVCLAGISTGTNNAFPEQRESTITGLAVGLAATGKIPPEIAVSQNKMLRVEKNEGEKSDIAIVDVTVTTDRFKGTRALWRSDNFRELFVTHADPEVIGLSAIAGILRPVGRQEPIGLHVILQSPEIAQTVIQVPIAPGLIKPVGVQNFEKISSKETIPISSVSGMIALDGEREIDFGPGDQVKVTLVENAFKTINVSACMHYAVKAGQFRACVESINPNEL